MTKRVIMGEGECLFLITLTQVSDTPDIVYTILVESIKDHIVTGTYIDLPLWDDIDAPTIRFPSGETSYQSIFFALSWSEKATLQHLLESQVGGAPLMDGLEDILNRRVGRETRFAHYVRKHFIEYGGPLLSLGDWKS